MPVAISNPMINTKVFKITSNDVCPLKLISDLKPEVPSNPDIEPFGNASEFLLMVQMIQRLCI
jgi:hypothetical protein